MRAPSLLVALLLLAAAASCSRRESPDPHAREPAALASSPAIVASAPTLVLEDCPEGDASWAHALREAGSRGDLEALRTRVEPLATTCEGRWEPRWTLGEIAYFSSQPEAASALASRALALAEDADAAEGVALCRYRLGWLAYRSGEVDRALVHYRPALAAAERSGRDDLLAQVLNGLAGALVESGRLGEAHVQMKRAARALEGLGLAPFARRTALNRAIVLMLLGDAESARESLEGVYRESEEAGDGEMLPRAALALGNLQRRLGEYEDAEAWYARVSGADAELAGLARLSRAQTAIRRGRLDEARAHLAVALESTAPVDRLLAEAYLAEADLAAGEADAALARLEGVVQRGKESDAQDVVWVASWLAGQAHLVAGRPVEAAARLREVVRFLDRQGSDLDPLAEGFRFLRERSDVYTDLAAALCGAGLESADSRRAEELLAVIEKTHARALRRAAGGLHEEAPPHPATLAELQRGLGEDELLLDFAIGRERGVVIALRRDDLRARVLPGWESLRAPLRAYRAALTRPLWSAEAALDPRKDLGRSLEEGRILTSALLEPLRPLLGGVRRVFVVPDRDLALVPFAALPWGEDDAFFGSVFETAVLPRAGVPLLSAQPRSPLLLAGDPLPGPESAFPRLPHATRELATIGALWGRSQRRVLLGAELRKSALETALSGGIGTLHLATHARASTSDPGQCAVHLSRDERLGLDAIVDLPLDDALVVLSACETGSGELIPGEGVVGLGWAFLRAGADAVVVSLWSVEDESATELMVAFHAGLRDGNDPIRSMAAARRELARRRWHPAHWAPFVVIANP